MKKDTERRHTILTNTFNYSNISNTKCCERKSEWHDIKIGQILTRSISIATQCPSLDTPTALFVRSHRYYTKCFFLLLSASFGRILTCVESWPKHGPGDDLFNAELKMNGNDMSIHNRWSFTAHEAKNCHTPETNRKIEARNRK